MNETCGCCEGIEQLTPLAIANRPGLDALFYRVGTHASFLETMLARLSNLPLRLGDVDILLSDPADQDKLIYPLQGLTTRAESDPAIALLDAWATVAHVLTFYQERIANEGYLRTATERRSILELARLVGYVLRPGVAASVFLAYTLEKDHNVIILPGNRAQSVPDPGELPQSFETAEKLEARFDWNTLKPRLTQPQFITLIPSTNPTEQNRIQTHTKDGAIYFKGTTTHLKEGDPLLFVFDVSPTQPQFAFPIISKVEAQAAEIRTKVTLVPLPQTLSSTAATNGAHGQANNLQVLARGNLAATNGGFFLRNIVDRLKEPPSLQPPNTQRLERSVTQAFSAQSDIHPQLLVNLTPALQGTLYSAISNAPGPVSSQPVESIQAFRVKAAPFGHNAPLKPILNNNGATVGFEEWPLGSVKIDLQLLLRSGAGSGGEITFGNRVINKVAVTITLDTKLLAKKEVDLTENQIKGVDAIPSVHLDNTTTLDIKITPGGDGALNQMMLTFTKGSEQQIIHLTDQTLIDAGVSIAQVGIRINPDPMWLLSPGQKQRYSTDQHRVEMEFGKDAITISDELLASVSSSLSLLDSKILPLDAQYDKIIPESWVVVERPDKNVITKVQHVQTVSIAAYGITGRVTQLTLYEPWLEPTDQLLSDVRSITVFAQSAALHSQSAPGEQAEEPIDEGIESKPPQIPKVGTDTIELDRLYDGLHSGQRLIVSGERTDVISNKVTVTGVKASELVMLKNVRQDVQQVQDPTDSTGKKTIPLPGDKKHTFLQFANALKFTYKRETLTIYANVVRATHGETRSETLGSGDGSKALQQFALRQSPLTYVSASTPAGAESTLQVRINDVLWHEVDSLPGLKPTDHSYITETDDAAKTTVIFGNGKNGARLPTGVENVKAVYRTGIGKPGNVKEGQITLLATKPLGVKSVVNPIKASGGADRENRDQARRNVPLAAIALDRLVSVQDYEDFARTFAGIGKASAVRLSDRHRQLVHLSIAGADNIPIETTSDLYRNLFQALRQFGDPNQPLTVEIAEVKFIVISAKVRLLPDYLLESVEPKIRTRLLDTFSFDRRELGQSVFQNEVLSVIQSIAGVDYVDLEILGALDETKVINTLDDFTKNPPPDPPKEEAGEPQETDEAGETAPEELAEEFLEALGLTGHDDIAVNLAKMNPNPLDPPKPFLVAQLAFLSPDVPDTLIITELPR